MLGASTLSVAVLEVVEGSQDGEQEQGRSPAGRQRLAQRDRFAADARQQLVGEQDLARRLGLAGPTLRLGLDQAGGQPSGGGARTGRRGRPGSVARVASGIQFASAWLGSA